MKRRREDIINTEDIIAKVGEDRIREAVESEDADALKNLLDEEGISLDDEQLDNIAGGIIMPMRFQRTRRFRKPKPSPLPVVEDEDDFDDEDSPE